MASRRTKGAGGDDAKHGLARGSAPSAATSGPKPATGSRAGAGAGANAGAGSKASPRSPARDAKGGARGGRAGASRGDDFLSDEPALREIEGGYPEGLSSAQIVEAFTARGVHLSEATFRKWVQMGLLPRSRRVGRKGKHQGSLGLYPPEVVRRIAAIKRRMGESLTIEDIARSLRFREAIETIERELRDLWKGFREALAQPDSQLSEGERKGTERLLEQCERHSGELVKRVAELERRVVDPLDRDAKARAFGSGSGGGAGDLL